MAISSNKHSQLLKSVEKIVARHRNHSAQLGTDFNIFQIIGLTSDEVRVHSAFLANLLNPRGTHHQGDLFLQLFIKQLRQIGFDFDTRSAVVQCEKYIGQVTDTTGGQIDIHIEDNKGHKIIIENKIYATDQANQLIRYHNYAPNAMLLYLTLDGKMPGKDSAGHLTDGQDFYRISYANDILGWLIDCYKAVVRIPMLAEGINHYIYLIKIMTNQSTNIKMTKEIAKVISSDSSTIQSALEIQRALSEVKINIQQLFWDKLIAKFPKDYHVEKYFCDAVVPDLSKYISSFVKTNASGSGDTHKNKWYGIEVVAAKIHGYSIKWRIEVDHNIYYGFKIRKGNHLALSGNRIFDILHQRLSDNFWQNGETWLCWSYPKGNRINFREFNSPEIFGLADGNYNMIDRLVEESIIHIEDMRSLCADLN